MPMVVLVIVIASGCLSASGGNSSCGSAVGRVICCTSASGGASGCQCQWCCQWLSVPLVVVVQVPVVV